MKLSIIIVNYNVKFYVEQCLDSLSRALHDIDSEIIVVDNHSRDDSVGYLRRRHRDIHIIESNHNLGFAKANNVAIRQSVGEYVLLLNPDTFVGEQTIRSVIDFMDTHPEAGGAGVRMYNADGTVAMESRRGLPTPLTSFYKMIGLGTLYPKNRHFGKYYMSYLPWDSPQQIEVVSGAFCMLRRSALDKVGILDEDFFMYGEDIDLSYRLLKGGYTNWYIPEPILHYKGESTQKSSFRYVHVFYNAMLIFFRKHYGHLSFCITYPIRAAIYFKAFLALISMQTNRMRRSLGFVDRRIDNTLYYFIGSAKMNEKCREISRRRGLTAEFRECRRDDLRAAEELSAEIVSRHTSHAKSVLVFDTDSFAYSDILKIMSSQSTHVITIGTYSSHTKTIITRDEILR